MTQLYRLPVNPPIRISQGYNSLFTHQEMIHDDEWIRGEFALDFIAKEGTPVYVSRDGIVKFVELESDFNYSPKFFQKPDDKLITKAFESSNEIIIQHDDETIATYAHLQKNSGEVNVGQRVHAGDLLARIGNVGLSYGAHLHFEVGTIDEYGYKSLPIEFANFVGSLEDRDLHPLRYNKLVRPFSDKIGAIKLAIIGFD